MDTQQIDGDHSFTGEIEQATAGYIRIDRLINTIKTNTWTYTLSIVIGVFATIFLLKHFDKNPLTSSQDRSTIVTQTLTEGAYLNFWIFGSSVLIYSFVNVIGTFMLNYIMQDYIASAQDLAVRITSINDLEELNFIHQQLVGVPHLDEEALTTIKYAINERAIMLNIQNQK